MAYIGKLMYPIHKYMIRQYYIQRFSVSECAIMYKVPEATVQHIVRGLKQFRHERI